MHTFHIHKMHVREERQEASSSEPEEMSTRRIGSCRQGLQQEVSGPYASTSVGHLWKKLRECEPDPLLCPEGQGNNT